MEAPGHSVSPGPDERNMNMGRWSKHLGKPDTCRGAKELGIDRMQRVIHYNRTTLSLTRGGPTGVVGPGMGNGDHDGEVLVCVDGRAA